MFLFINMSNISDNVNNLLNNQFENHDYLPQKLMIEDMDLFTLNFLKEINLAIVDENDNMIPVPVIFLSQERWAEFRNNWKHLRDEAGREITMPFSTIRRISVKPGQNPLKRTTIPQHTFTYLKVPVITGNLKAYDIYQIPQSPRVDITYELRFFSHYMQDTNKSYEKFLSNIFQSGYKYINMNGHWVPLELVDLNEENSVEDITADRRFQIIYNLILHGKIVDPSQFVKKQSITKINLNIKENLR